MFAQENQAFREMTREERKIIGVTTAAHGLNHGFVLIFSAVLPMLQRDFHTDYFHLGIIGNICFLAFGVGSFGSTLSGYMADLLGLEWVFHAMGFLFVVSGILAFLLIIPHPKRPPVAPAP